MLACGLTLALLLFPGLARGWETEPNDTLESASALVVGTLSHDIPAQVSPAGDVDWYKVAAEDRGVYTVMVHHVAPSLSGGFTVTAYDAHRNVLARSFAGTEAVLETAEVEMTTPGSFYLEVKANDAAQVGTYSITVYPQFMPTSEEPDGTRFISHPITPGVVFGNSLSERSTQYLSRPDADVFRVTSQRKAEFEATITSRATPLRVRTLDHAGEQISVTTCSTTTTCRFDIALPAKEWVYLEVTSQTASGSGRYAACVRPRGEWCEGDGGPGYLVGRMAGSDRYATSAAIAQAMAGGNSNLNVFVASGEVFTDALSGGGVAGAQSRPILLVTRDRIPAVVAQALRAVRPQRITILGGPATIGPAVEKQLSAFLADDPSGVIERWAGTDRYATSAIISSNYFQSGVETAYVASGRVFPDALAGAAVAGMKDNGYVPSPLLLVDRDEIPADIATELTRLRPQRIFVLGGTNTIHDNVIGALEPFTTGSVERRAGADRYETAAAISASTYPVGESGSVFITSGEVFPDALAAGPWAGSARSPILLVRSGSIPASTAAELRRIRPRFIQIVGGPATVSDDVRRKLESYAAW